MHRRCVAPRVVRRRAYSSAPSSQDAKPRPLDANIKPEAAHTLSPDLSIRHAVLIDVNPLIYRSFYSHPTMTRSDGVHVNAVYGYTRCQCLAPSVLTRPRAMLKIIRDLSAQYIGESLPSCADDLMHLRSLP